MAPSVPDLEPPCTRHLGEEADFTILDLSFEGKGVARTHGMVTFIPLTVPGDQVRARITRVEKRFCEAELLNIIQPSEIRQTPRCLHFGSCGGCQLQTLPYEHQFALKKRSVLDALARRKVTPASVECHPALAPWKYRTRAQLHRRSDGRYGFHAAGSHDVIAIDECPVLHESLQVHLGNLSLHTEPTVHLGEKILGQAPPFHQINQEANEVLQQWIATKAADFISPETICCDLYGGSGNLTHKITSLVKHTYCLDLAVPQDQEANRTFIAGPISKTLRKIPPHDACLVIADPPRIGLSGDLACILKHLDSISAFILIGCDPIAFAKDASMLITHGFSLTSILIIDFFPQTHHVETGGLFVLPSTARRLRVTT